MQQLAIDLLPFDPDFTINQIYKLKFEYFGDGRPGGLGDIALTNHMSFFIFTTENISEIWCFRDSSVRTYYDLHGAPKEKTKAIQALNQRNKLNEESALVLAGNYFRLQGHKEENFHPPEIRQCFWADGVADESVDRRLPAYEIRWYHKGVKGEDRDSGRMLPQVNITVSGITSNLVYYSKPIGSSF